MAGRKIKNTEYVEIINRQYGEIESLKKAIDNYESCLESVETIRIKAIKEFWNQRPPHLFVTKKGENLYNDGWNDCLAVFTEEYEIFLGVKNRKECGRDNDPVKEMVGERE